MIILSDWDRIGDSYRMVLKMSVNDSIDDLPSANRPMNPEFFAVSKEYGIPADGSVVIENGKPTLVYKDGEWENATEGGGGDVKVGYIELQSGRYNPEDVIKVLAAADMVLIKSVGEKIGFIYNFMTSTSQFRFQAPDTHGEIRPINNEIEDETKAKIVEILKTKFSNQISVTYT